MTRGAVCIALLVWLSLPSAYALDPSRTLSQYIHRIWQARQGLPQATILSIGQTHDGYLWLGTQAGPVRFDGVRFTPIDDQHALLLSNTWVRHLLEDDQLNLWMATNDSGVLRLANGTLTQFSTAQGLPSNSVHCLVAMAGGELWVCTPNGLGRLMEDKFVRYGAEQGLSTNHLRAGCATPQETLWVGGDSVELNRWDGARWSRRKLNSLPPQASVRALLCSPDDTIWIGTTHGLVRLTGEQEHRFTVTEGLADNWVFSLAVNREGGLWIGTNNGLSRLGLSRLGVSRLSNGEFENFRSSDGLSQSAVYSLYEDREGSLWVGTKHGLNQFLEGRMIPYTEREGLPSNDTGPVFQDRQGHIWIGTLGAGLARFNGRRFDVLSPKQGLASNTIYALADDMGGYLWVGTDAGLNRLRDGQVTETYTHDQGLPSNTVRCLFRDSQGTLWAGTSAGPAILRGARFVPPAPTPTALKTSVLAIGEDRQHRVFIATEGGPPWIYSHGQLQEFPRPGLPARDMDAFFEDRDGLLWIGTLGSGLRLLKDGKIINYGMQNGLFDDEIYGITADDQDRLWMACSKGIFSVHRSDLLKFAAGTLRKFVSAPYSPLDALRVIECKPGVQPAVWKMRDGQLWFSTIRGLMVLDPGRLDRKLPPPPVTIEEVTVNGERVDPRGIERMPPGEKNVEFRYTGLNFFVPGRITFRYRLEGFDKQWINAGTRREALYTNLPPGTFVFHVIACNADGTCGQTGSSVAFTLAPHYYQRTWFLFLGALVLAALAWVIYQLRIRRLQEQFGAVLAERTRIARELHDTLLQGFSGVTMQMQALCARLSSSEHRRTLEEIIRDAAKALREARWSLASLRSTRSARSGLAAAIAEAAKQIEETKDIRVKLKLEPNIAGLPADVEYNLLRIAQEAVTNSVKHSGARTVEVSLQSSEESLRLAVKDDGRGLRQDEHLERGGSPGHYGLMGMKERASQIGAGLEIESEPGRGTTILVRLPARKFGGKP